LQNNAPQAFSLVGSGFVLTATLPVKWINFEGENLSDKVQLNWRTVNEINNAGFDIERSTNNQNFGKIGYVKGYGNTVNIQKYDFIDELINLNNIDPVSDKLYYRLKQTDYDGNYHYSKTISVDAPSMFGVFVYPNPFNEFLNVAINSNISNQNCDVKLLDLSGRELITKSFTTNNKEFIFEIKEVNMLNPGIYFIRIIVNGKIFTNKIVKIN
jgi:hypothetical protein